MATPGTWVMFNFLATHAKFLQQLSAIDFQLEILLMTLTIRAFSVVYLIWYGTWTTSAKNIIQNFVTNLGSTAWWGINKAYGVGTVAFGKGADVSTYCCPRIPTESMLWFHQGQCTKQF